MKDRIVGIKIVTNERNETDYRPFVKTGRIKEMNIRRCIPDELVDSASSGQSLL